MTLANQKPPPKVDPAPPALCLYPVGEPPLEHATRCCAYPQGERRAVLERALFTAEEVAEALAVSESLVRQLTLSRELPCRRIGRLVRYSRADIEAFILRYDERGYKGQTNSH